MRKLYTKTVSGEPIVLTRDSEAGLCANGAPILMMRRQASGLMLIGDGVLHVVSLDDYGRLRALLRPKAHQDNDRD